MNFLYKSFFVNYILSFSLVQVQRHWVQFTLARRGYDNHNCHNKPQMEIGLECEWRHARKRWAENLEILKKTPDESRLWTSRVGSRLLASRVGSLQGTNPVGCRMGTCRVGSRLGPCKRTVEVEFRPWCWEVGVSTFGVSTVFLVPTSEDERRSITPRDVLSVYVLLV